MGKTFRRERAYFDDETYHRRYVKQKRKKEHDIRLARHKREISSNTIYFDNNEDEYEETGDYRR